EVIGAAAIKPGTPLLQVDTDAVAERVAAIRRVASARVQRQYPSTLRVTVIERMPVVVKDYPDGPHLFDKDGVDFANAPPPAGVPYLDADNPGPSDPATRAALQVITALRPDVAGQVGRIAAPSVAAITLTLTDGRVVVWGTTDRTDEKALKLGALMTPWQKFARKFSTRPSARLHGYLATPPYRSGCAEQLDITITLWLRLRVCQRVPRVDTQPGRKAIDDPPA